MNQLVVKNIMVENLIHSHMHIHLLHNKKNLLSKDIQFKSLFK